jgi:site-specific DNA recombinase
VKSFDEKGEPDRGRRTINKTEADVVRRVFREYAAGASPKRIAVRLNREGISGPAGREWGFTTIYGSSKRGNGILNNEMYVGRIVYPGRSRVAHHRPGSLGCCEDATAGGQAERRDRRRERNLGASQGTLSAFWSDTLRRLWRWLFDDLCHSPRVLDSAQQGYLQNRMAIKRTDLEERVLSSLKSKLMDPALFREFCDEFTREMNRLRMEGGATLTAARAEVKRIDRELDTLLNLILKGGHAERINAKMVQLEARKAELERARRRGGASAAASSRDGDLLP